MDPTAVVVPAPAGGQTTVLLALFGLFVIYFGPALLRVALKPERGSKLDLRIAWFETKVADFEKSAKITQKLAALAKLPPTVVAVMPPPSVSDTERDTLPPVVTGTPPAPTTDDLLSAEVPVPKTADTDRRGYDSVPPEKEEPEEP